MSLVTLGCADTAELPAADAGGSSSEGSDASSTAAASASGGPLDSETDSTEGPSPTSAATSNDEDGESGTEDTGAPVDDPPLFERGLIVAPDTLPCFPVSSGGASSLDCNHHGSTIAQLATGEIAAVWYHGEAEKSEDVRLVWSRTNPEAGAADWSAPEVLFDDPERSEGNPAIWVSETGEILVFFVSIYGDGWSETKIRLVRSTDDGETFSAPQLLRDNECWNTRQKPLRLSNGTLMLPLYLECLALPMFMTSNDDFVDDVQWTEFEAMPDSGDYFAAHLGQIQPSLALRDDGTISALTRNGLNSGAVREMIGDAAGESWSASQDIALPNSGTSIDQVRLDNGNRVVIYNDSPEVRFPLAAALSVDDGATYSATRTLVGECDDGVDECEFHYPSVTQASDGSLWVSYTHDGTTIGWVHFNEAWLQQGD